MTQREEIQAAMEENHAQMLNDMVCMFNLARDECFNIAKSKGFHETDVDDSILIALIHSEASEALEAYRHGNPPSEHIPEYSGVEEEIADIIIRCLDWAGKRNYDVGGAVLSKMEFNKGREYRHGGKKV